MKEKLLLVLFVTLGLFFTSNVYSQESNSVKVANDYELVQAMNNPNVVSVEITQDGYYESLGDYVINGTVVTLGEFNGGSRAACTLSISKSDGCFVTGTAAGVVTASTSGDPSCPPTPSSGAYGWSVTNKPAGATVVFIDGVYTLEMDFTVDMPGQYTLKYAWDDFNVATTNVFFWSTPTVTLTPTTDDCGEQSFSYTMDAGVYPGPQSMTELWEVTDGSLTTVSFTAPTGGTFTFDPTDAEFSTLDQCGDYTIEVTVTNPANGANCSSSDSKDIYIYDTPQNLNAGMNQDICEVGGVFSTPISGTHDLVTCDDGSTPTVAWSHTGGGGSGTISFANSTASSTTVSSTACGEYVLTFTVTNGNCVTSSTTTVNFYDLADGYSAGADQDVCETGSAYSATLAGVTGTVSCGTLSGVWTVTGGSGSGTITFADDTDPTTTVTSTACGDYVLTYTVTNGGAPSCDVSDAMTLTFYDLATNVEAGDNQDVCEDGSGFMTTLGSSYTDVSCGTTSGMWSVTGGSGSGTITFADATMTNTTITSTACGDYELTYTVTSGGGTASCDASDVMTVNFYDLAAGASAGDDQDVCENSGYSATLAGSLGTVSCGTTSGLWTVTSGTPSDITFADDTDATTTVTSTTCGEYELTYTVTSGGGTATCTTSDAMTLTFYDLATSVDAGADQDVCEYNAPGKTPGFPYQTALDASFVGGNCGTSSGMWSVTGGTGTGTIYFTDASVSNTTVTSTACGEYVLTYTVTSGGGTATCTVTDDMTLYFYDLPDNVSAGTAQDVCEDGAGDFIASLTGSFGSANDVSCDNGTAPTVEWSAAAGNPGTTTFTTATSTTTDAEVSVCGSYTFWFEVTNGPGCSVSNSVTVDFFDEPEILNIVAPDKVCGYTTSAITGSNSMSCGTPTVAWTTTSSPAGAATPTFGNGTTDNPTVTVTTCGEYTFEYSVSNITGCETTSSTTIIFYDPPSITVAQGTPSGDVYTCSSVSYNVTNSACGSSLWTYSWNVTGGTISGSSVGTGITVIWDQTSGTAAGNVSCTASTIGLSGCGDVDDLDVDLIEPTFQGQVKYWNEFETYMPTPFPTNFNGAYPQDYFYAELWDGSTMRESTIVQPNLQFGLSGDSTLLSYYGFTIPTTLDGCSGTYYVKVWDGGLSYDPGAPAGSAPLGASYTYTNWGGVNATDAYAIQLMAAGSDLNTSYPWVGLNSGSPLYGFYSNDIADVNTSGTTITALDALIVNYRAVGLLANYPNSGSNLFSPNFAVAGRMVSELPDPTWDDYFASCVTKGSFCDDVQFTHSGDDYMYYDDAADHKYMSAALPWLPEANLMNIYYTAEGDINASYVPTSGGFKSLENIDLVYENLVGTHVDQVITIPVKIDRDAEVNAISLFMNYRNDLIEVIGTNYGEDYVFIDQEEGILNIGWFSTDTRDVEAEEIIAQIKVRVLAEIPEGTELFELNMNTELADATATPIEDITLKTIGVTTDKVAFTGTELTTSIYPNPFSNRTTITYTLPETGKVRIDVINNMGTVVANIVEEVQEAGVQSLVYNADLSPGIYFYSITLQGEANTYSTVERMIVVN